MNPQATQVGSAPLPPDILALIRQILAERFHLKRPEEILLQDSAALGLPPPQPALESLLELLSRLEELGRGGTADEAWRRRLATLVLAGRRCQWQWQELSCQLQILQQQLQDLARDLLPALYQSLPALQEEVAAITAKLQPLIPPPPEDKPQGGY